MDLKDIKAIIDLMRKNAISEFELEKEGFKIKLKRGANGSSNVITTDEPLSATVPLALPATASGAANPAANPASPLIPEIEIKAPMVGTFYRAPAPDAGPYVEIGTEINPDTVVCIIEAMKVMNEIKAEVRGVISQVLTENGKPVEFGQALFKIKPL